MVNDTPSPGAETRPPAICGEESHHYSFMAPDAALRKCIRPLGHRMAHTDGECWWGGLISLGWKETLARDDRLASLEAELAEARKDSMRLDWLGDSTWQRWSVKPITTAQELREAIDAAQRGPTSQEKGQ